MIKYKVGEKGIVAADAVHALHNGSPGRIFVYDDDLIVKTIPSRNVLMGFARAVALSVIDYWRAPKVLVEYLSATCWKFREDALRQTISATLSPPSEESYAGRLSRASSLWVFQSPAVLAAKKASELAATAVTIKRMEPFKCDLPWEMSNKWAQEAYNSQSEILANFIEAEKSK